MKKSAALLAVFAALAMSPSSFADGAMGTGKSIAGSTAAFIVDVPEGIVVNTLSKCPKKARKSLAAAFGDEGGWKQNIAGAIIGWPCGVAFGVPYGAIKGGEHAINVGWDQPFSKDSFVVTNEK